MFPVNFNRTSFVNTELFTSKYTPESCYLLGFIWGDGYLYDKKRIKRISVECVRQDLENIEHVFDATGIWNKTYRNRPNRQPQAIFSTQNKELLDYLSKYNYINKSNLSTTIVETIPENLQHYWWRGYFDADGCIYINKNCTQYQVFFTSSYEQDWTFCEKLFNQLSVKYSIKQTITTKNHSYSVIRLTGKANSKKLLDYIYTDYDFGLTRKYNKYCNYLI